MSTSRVHRAARFEDRAHAVLERWLRHRGWVPRIVPFTGYGSTRSARVLGRVLLAPPGTEPRELRVGRGWRRFFTATGPGVPVTVELGDRTHSVVSLRGGYVDALLDCDLQPGWAEVRLSVEGTAPVSAPLRIVDADGGLGIISDIDDTVIITALPRPLVAAWNTFVRHESSRRAVPGMATMFSEIQRHHGDVPVFYLSTGAWNVAPVLSRFLDRHGYPAGPLLLTDWGPTTEGWFRSGRDHKRREIQRLVAELPQVRWLLVGDDGQHDPEIYAEAAAEHPDRVRAVAIRRLSAGEQVRTHGTPEPLHERGPRAPTPHDEVRAPDGFGLLAALRERGVVNG